MVSQTDEKYVRSEPKYTEKDNCYAYQENN